MELNKKITHGLMGILSYFTRHQTASNLLLVIMILGGLSAAPKMRSQFFPDVVIEMVSVHVVWTGAGPEEVDNAIVQLIEPALLTLEGIENTLSTSSQGYARIRVNFQPGWDMARATEDVKAIIDGISDFPEGAEEPKVRRGAWRDRVTDVVITGPVSKNQLALFADELVSRLFEEGITGAIIRGVASPETIIEIKQVDLIKNDLTLHQIAKAIGEEAETDPAGSMASGAARVRTGVEKRSFAQIAEIVVKSNADGSKIRVSDIAAINVQEIDRDRAYFVGKDPAISVRVNRSDKGDAISIQSSVEKIAAEMEAYLPSGTKIKLIRTRAEHITKRINLLVDNGLIGLALVIGLLFLFLNARTAFWVAMGIPAALIATIGIMYIAGLTINMISLFALIITLGIVVDDAIVVGEHADFRARNLGEDPTVAAENAAIRMAPPVFSATITTIIAFSGLTLISGRFGDFMADIPFTVIVVLFASLVECFLILPNHMSHALKNINKKKWYDTPSYIFNIGFGWFRKHIFRNNMKLIIKFRYPVLALTFVVLASQAVLFLNGSVQWRFFNAPERGSISGNFAMLPEATREDTLEMMIELQRAANDTAKKFEKEYGINPLDFVMAEIGGNSGRVLAGSEYKDKDLLGAISIELIDADLRPYSSYEYLGDLQNNVKNHPALETISFRNWTSGPGGDSLSVQLFGADSNILKSASEKLKSLVAIYPEVSAVEDDLAYDKEELILDLTAQGQALGFTIDQLGTKLRHRLNGITAAKYPLGSRTAKITVQMPKEELSADFIDRTMLRTPKGKYVPMSDIVSVTSNTGFATIKREDGLRVITVTGDISEDDPDRANFITEQLKTNILPQIEQDFQIKTKLSGLAEQENTFLNDALFGFVLCLLGIYLTLAWIFSSWARPAVVMAIIPFGLVGAVYGHYVWEVPLSMFSVIGLIGMTGIIINDSIVLVSTVDEYAKDRGFIKAIIDGACDRLRPVVLTTLTTVLGMAPLLFEKSQGAQFLKPTVITLVYGLGFGMILVLIVVPSLLAMQLDISRQIRSFKSSISFKHKAFGLRLISLSSSLLIILSFIVTLGWVIVTGSINPLIESYYQKFGMESIYTWGLGAYIFLTIIIILTAYLFNVLIYKLKFKKTATKLS
jgi:multidrug efflux pump subunit AcrB